MGLGALVGERRSRSASSRPRPRRRAGRRAAAGRRGARECGSNSSNGRRQSARPSRSARSARTAGQRPGLVTQRPPEACPRRGWASSKSSRSERPPRGFLAARRARGRRSGCGDAERGEQVLDCELAADRQVGAGDRDAARFSARMMASRGRRAAHQDDDVAGADGAAPVPGRARRSRASRRHGGDAVARTATGSSRARGRPGGPGRSSGSRAWAGRARARRGRACRPDRRGA